MSIEISPAHRNLLVEEVLVQAHLAIEAYIRLRKTVANAETRQRREVWAFIQSALSHTAMMSKYMDPPKKSQLSKARAKALKELLVVDKTSPVLSRKARNNVEHLDERLALWLSAGEKPIDEFVFVSRKDSDYLIPPEAGERRRFVKRVYLIDEDTFMSED